MAGRVWYSKCIGMTGEVTARICTFGSIENQRASKRWIEGPGACSIEKGTETGALDARPMVDAVARNESCLVIERPTCHSVGWKAFVEQSRVAAGEWFQTFKPHLMTVLRGEVRRTARAFTAALSIVLMVMVTMPLSCRCFLGARTSD